MKIVDKKWKKLFAIGIAATVLLSVGGISTFRAVEASAFGAARNG